MERWFCQLVISIFHWLPCHRSAQSNQLSSPLISTRTLKDCPGLSSPPLSSFRGGLPASLIIPCTLQLLNGWMVSIPCQALCRAPGTPEAQSLPWRTGQSGRRERPRTRMQPGKGVVKGKRRLLCTGEREVALPGHQARPHRGGDFWATYILAINHVIFTWSTKYLIFAKVLLPYEMLSNKV